MSAFLTPLDVEELDADRWRLLTSLVYDSDLAGRLLVPAGFVTDLESIPRWVPFAYAVAKGTAKRAAVVHDWLYEQFGSPKDLDDDIFYEAMGVLGIGWLQRHLMWEAVHVWGTPNYLKRQARARARLS